MAGSGTGGARTAWKSLRQRAARASLAPLTASARSAQLFARQGFGQMCWPSLRTRQRSVFHLVVVEEEVKKNTKQRRTAELK